MRRRGRPKGSGYDDFAAIDHVCAVMRIEGVSRRSAIIRICGPDQLRRIEVKMTALAHDTPGNWRQDMVENVREELKAQIEARTLRSLDDDVVLDQVGYYDVVDMSECATLYRMLGFGMIYASAELAAPT